MQYDNQVLSGWSCMKTSSVCHIIWGLYENFMIFRPESSQMRRFGLNWPSVWVKLASSWCCIIIYIVTLLFPTCLPGRNYGHIKYVDDPMDGQPVNVDVVDGSADPDPEPLHTSTV